MHADVSGSGPRVFLFIHGFGGFGGLWREQTRYFGKDARVLAVDLPGHGSTPWNDPTVADMALEIVAVLDTARVTSGIHVVASSFGALPALELWRLRPAALLSLTLAGGLPRFTSAKDYPAGLDAARIERLGAQLAGDRAMVLDMFFRSLFTRAERERPAYAGVKALRAAGPLPSFAGLAGTLDLLEGTDLRALFSDVRAPVQFITGDADPICPLSVIEPLRALQPMLRVDVMKGCGHFPFLSHPEEFNTVVRGFTG